MPILVLGLSHHTAPVTVREKFAVSEARVPAILQLLRQGRLADEVVILSTCNRVEMYVVTEADPRRAFEELQHFLVDCHQYRDPLTDEIYRLTEPQSIEHLFRVACGLDSMVLGETEILGQLKKAYQIALEQGHTGARLNKAFQKAFNVAKQIRTETNIQRGSVSVGSVAVELAEKIFETLADRDVMVLGAGETSEKTARALMSRGARSILVSNRSYERAAELAGQLNGRAIHFEDWGSVSETVDIIISSTSAPHYILDRPKLEPLMRRRRNRSLLLIDIAVPRDIDPEVNMLEGVYLYNIDDLQAIADNYLRQRREELDRCHAFIAEKARSLTGHRSPPSVPPASRPAFGHE